MKKAYYILLGIILVHMVSCKEEEELTPLLTGYWKQYSIFIDENPIGLSPEELNTSLFIEANGIYRLYDGTTGTDRI